MSVCLALTSLVQASFSVAGMKGKVMRPDRVDIQLCFSTIQICAVQSLACFTSITDRSCQKA